MPRNCYLAILWLFVSLVPCAFAQRAGRDPHALGNFQTALQQDGFDVSVGVVAKDDPAARWCASQPGVENAGYYNKEPYLGVKVPTPETGQPSPEFKLRPDEAIVLVGLTPPPSKYFSYTPYLFSRVYPDGDGKPRPVLATLGDAVNNATVTTTGPTPFNSPVALIFTPDQGTDARVRAALLRVGYPAAIINTVVFPASMLTLGLDDAADQLKIGLRTAMWLKQAQAAGDAYIASPPLTVFRVTPRTPATKNPFPAPRLRIRGTGQSEMELADELNKLREGIKTNFGLHATDIMTMPMCFEGYDLIQRRFENCGDSRDAFYVGAGLPEFDDIQITLDDDEFLMVYGVNHVATGKATYMNINVYGSYTGKLTLGGLDDSQFHGTASPYLPAGDPAADLMYAY